MALFPASSPLQGMLIAASLSLGKRIKRVLVSSALLASQCISFPRRSIFFNDGCGFSGVRGNSLAIRG
jgi:hypothetical protein